MRNSSPTFSELTQAVCRAAGVEPPPLAPDAQGGYAFSLSIDDVTVSIAHYPAHFAEHAFVLVRFGAVPPASEAEVFRELLNANLMVLRPGAPAFARDPLDGHIVLQVTCALSETSGEALLAGIRVAVGKAIDWRSTHRLIPQSSGTSAQFGTSFA
jgi:hypothetical protein